MKDRKNWLTLGSCNLLFALTFVFFAPMEVLLLNSGEFHFTFISFWWFQLLLALAGAGLLTLGMQLLPGKAKVTAAAMALGASAAAWVQMLMLNGKMIRLVGEEMQVSGPEKLWNGILWIAVAAGVVITAWLLSRRGKDVRGWMSAAAAFLTAVQLIAFVSLLFTTDYSVEEDSHSFTCKGEFELSSGTNVVEFMLDASDGEFVHQMLDAYPEVKDQLNGWVYYPNAVSMYSRTFPSLIYMLSGAKTHLDVPVKEYVDAAFAESDFLPNLNAAGTDIRIYTMDNSYVSTATDGMVQNSRKRENVIGDLNLVSLEKGLARISLYKCMPYFAKPWFSYEVGVLNAVCFRESNYIWYDPVFYSDLRKQASFTVNGNYDRAYRFYHLWGSHGGAWWNDRLETVEEDTESYERLRGSFRILDEYCEKLKAAGLYDSALIIVTADHGVSNDDLANLARNRAACPLMMVKYPYSDEGKLLEVSRKPVCHDDLFSTIADALGAERPTAGSGRTIREIADDEVRERYHYYTALDKRWKPKLMREYVVRGDAEDFASWQPTGNTWDVLIDW